MRASCEISLCGSQSACEAGGECWHQNQIVNKTPRNTPPSHVHLLQELQLLKNWELLFNHPFYDSLYALYVYDASQYVIYMPYI